MFGGIWAIIMAVFCLVTTIVVAVKSDNLNMFTSFILGMLFVYWVDNAGTFFKERGNKEKEPVENVESIEHVHLITVKEFDIVSTTYTVKDNDTTAVYTIRLVEE